MTISKWTFLGLKQVKLFSFFPLSFSFNLNVFLCSCLSGTPNPVDVETIRVCVSPPQTWQWAVRSVARTVEAEYWSLTVTETFPHKVWHWAKSFELPAPPALACLDMASLWEEAKTWTAMSILVNKTFTPVCSAPRYNQNVFSDVHSFASLLSSFSATFLTSAFHLSHICSSMFSVFSSFPLLNSSETGGYGDVCHELLPHPSFRDLQYSRRRERLHVLSARRGSNRAFAAQQPSPSDFWNVWKITLEK